MRPCLELTNQTRIYGWGLYVNQEVSMALQFASTGEDAVQANYKYSFFPGAVYNHEPSWVSHPEISFVQGKGSAYYEWDAGTSTYQLVTNSYDGPEDLNKAKTATFGDFGNDSLFVRAFAYEIGETLREGTPEARRLLTTYLSSVKSKQRPLGHFGELEEKLNVNGTKFYGPKSK